MTREDVIVALVSKGAKHDRATLYADAFLLYLEAAENIGRNGAIVAHPRSGNPIANPYLEVRERAVAALAKLRDVKGDFLWTEPGGDGGQG